MAPLTDMTAAQAAALWSGLLILLLGVLSIRVILARRKYKVAIGDGGVPEVALAARVFGNAAEYIPVGIGALILLYHLEMPVLAIHGLGVTLLAGRTIHAVGLSGHKSTFGRVAGMVLTFVALFVAGGMLVVHAFV